MENPGLEDALWSQIDGRLWHATSSNALIGITADKEIKAAVGDRYVGSFCRNQGGVSLFDFGPNSENVEGQIRNWSGWFGHQQEARVAVWLEIDRAKVLENLLDAKAAREALRGLMDERRRQDKTHEPGITFIPGVEACHRGGISTAAVVGVLLIDQHNRTQFRSLGKLDDDTIKEISAFEATLPAHEEDPLVKALLAARKKLRD